MSSGRDGISLPVGKSGRITGGLVNAGHATGISFCWRHGSWPHEHTVEPTSQLSVSRMGICDRGLEKQLRSSAEMELGFGEQGLEDGGGDKTRRFGLRMGLWTKAGLDVRVRDGSEGAFGIRDGDEVGIGVWVEVETRLQQGGAGGCGPEELYSFPADMVSSWEEDRKFILRGWSLVFSILAALMMLSMVDGRLAYLQGSYTGYLGFWTDCREYKCVSLGQVTGQ